MGFPTVFEHMDACGLRRGKEVKVPAIAAAAALLVSRGSDQLIVPTPSAYEADRAGQGVELLPKERRHFVKLVDKKGETLRRVRSYLQPLAAQAHKWPEDAFVSLSEEFLYQVAIATDFRAGIASHAVQTVREFVPILNPQSFRGEARFRLGEVVSLICSYDASLGGHGSYRLDSVPNPETSSQIWGLIENAEFGEIVAIGGRIGYLRHPNVTFRRLRTVTRTFFKKPGVARMFSLASSVAELAGAKPISDQAKNIAALVNEPAAASFRPPFIDLGSASLSVYRLALASEQAAPASGAILLFEHTRRGKVSRSWLGTGEELKLQKEESDINGIKATVLQARSALGRFF